MAQTYKKLPDAPRRIEAKVLSLYIYIVAYCFLWVWGLAGRIHGLFDSDNVIFFLVYIHTVCSVGQGCVTFAIWGSQEAFWNDCRCFITRTANKFGLKVGQAFQPQPTLNSLRSNSFLIVKPGDSDDEKYEDSEEEEQNGDSGAISGTMEVVDDPSTYPRQIRLDRSSTLENSDYPPPRGAYTALNTQRLRLVDDEEPDLIAQPITSL